MFFSEAALNRPWEYGVVYLVVSNPASTDADAITTGAAPAATLA